MQRATNWNLIEFNADDDAHFTGCTLSLEEQFDEAERQCRESYAAGDRQTARYHAGRMRSLLAQIEAATPHLAAA